MRRFEAMQAYRVATKCIASRVEPMENRDLFGFKVWFQAPTDSGANQRTQTGFERVQKEFPDVTFIYPKKKGEGLAFLSERPLPQRSLNQARKLIIE